MRSRDAAHRLAKRRGLPTDIDAEPALAKAAFSAMEHLRVDGEAARAWAPMSGFFATADGWVRTHANYPHHAAVLSAVLGATNREELTRSLASRSALEVEDAVTAAGGVAVAVRSREEWAAHPHGAASADRPWVSTATTSGARVLPPRPRALLDGVHVLDLTRVIAGPTCSQLLACLGARVLRIDTPQHPEILEQYLSNGMGKRSAAIDFATAGVVPELLKAADVVLLGYRPGSLDRFGLSPDALSDMYPHLVVASLSAWGETGPWAGRRGFDSIVQAATGVATLCGSGGEPGALPVQALDHATGYRMAAEVMEMLAAGRAGVVRLSLLGAAHELLALGAPPDHEPAELPVRAVMLETAHGVVETVPPALTCDGEVLSAPIGEYGAADPCVR